MNRTSWIIIAITTIVVFLIGIFFLYPNIKDAWGIVRDTQNVKKDLAEITTREEVLTKLSKNNQLTDLYDIASKYIPENQDSSELVIELTAMADQANMKVEQVSLDTGTTPQSTPDNTDAESAAQDKTSTTKSTTPNLSELKFTLKLSGNFSDYLTFLKSAETSSRLITFNSMNLSQTDTTFTAQLTGLAYYKKGTSLENTLENIQITEATIAKFKNLKTYGIPINLPTESGFGRTNPFDAIE